MVHSAEPQGIYHLELESELESVVAARRLVASAASAWGIQSSISDNAALVASELVTNAVLHARTRVGIAVFRLGQGMRIEVSDGNDQLPLVDAARPEDLLANRSMTGRGLALVAATSDRWGADRLAGGGKVTWAEIGTGRRLVMSAPPPAFPPAARAPRLGHSALAAGVTLTAAVTGGGRQIHLIGVPVALLRESSRQLTDLKREIQVIALDRSSPPELRSAVEAGNSLTTEIDEWAEADRSIIEAASARGSDRLDFDLTIDDDAFEAIERLSTWIRRLAAGITRRHLLTLPASDEVTDFRRWYRDEVLSQLAGRPARPCPLDVPRS